MSRNQFKTSIYLNIGGSSDSEHEMDLVIDYSVDKGSPESGRYGPPEHYDPGAADELNILGVSVLRAGKLVPVTGTLLDLIEADEGLRAEILTEWAEAEQCAAEGAADLRYEMRREQQREAA